MSVELPLLSFRTILLFPRDKRDIQQALAASLLRTLSIHNATNAPSWKGIGRFVRTVQAGRVTGSRRHRYGKGAEEEEEAGAKRRRRQRRRHPTRRSRTGTGGGEEAVGEGGGRDGTGKK